MLRVICEQIGEPGIPRPAQRIAPIELYTASCSSSHADGAASEASEAPEAPEAIEASTALLSIVTLTYAFFARAHGPREPRVRLRHHAHER